MAPSVRIATRADLTAVARVMDQAFRTDPSTEYVLGDTPGAFDREHHLYVAMCATPAFDHDGVHLMVDGSGAAIWYPPGVSVSEHAWQAFVQNGVHPDRLDAIGALAERCDAYRPTGDHWTLELIAIDPAAQNRGIGGQLMGFGLALAAAGRLPTYLASSNARNLPFYRRFGFEVMAEVRLADLPPAYPMIRAAPQSR